MHQQNFATCLRLFFTLSGLLYGASIVIRGIPSARNDITTLAKLKTGDGIGCDVFWYYTGTVCNAMSGSPFASIVGMSILRSHLSSTNSN